MPSTRACALKHTWRCSGDSRSVAWKSLEQAMDFWGLVEERPFVDLHRVAPSIPDQVYRCSAGWIQSYIAVGPVRSCRRRQRTSKPAMHLRGAPERRYDDRPSHGFAKDCPAGAQQLSRSIRAASSPRNIADYTTPRSAATASGRSPRQLHTPHQRHPVVARFSSGQDMPA